MKPRHHNALIAAITLLALCGVALADDWPQFRGPTRDGAWSETGIIESIPAEGLKIQWRAKVGPGFASPVIAQERLFIVDSDVSGPKPLERVHCFEALTGKPVWTHSYDAAYQGWARDVKALAGPNATPIAHKGKLYTLGQAGDLFCLDAQRGEVVWHKDLVKDYEFKDFAGTPSPLIDGDLLILTIGGKPGGTVIALDKATGKEAWKALDEKPTHSSPVVIEAGGKRQLIVWTQESVTSLDPATGKTFWRQRLGTLSDYAVSTPVCRGNLLLIGGMMMQLTADKPGASVLWPDNTINTAKRVLSNTSTGLFLGDHVYSARSTGQLVCLEAATGTQVWEVDKITDLINGSSIHLTPNGDSVFLYTNQGNLIRARLTAKGYEELGRGHILDPTHPFGGRKVAWPLPAYSNRHIYVRSDAEVVCVSLAKP